MRSRRKNSHPAEPIPLEAYEAVVNREHGLCGRCSMPGSEWHHRRSRRVRDGHQHCPCNGVWLCRGCHRWAHANPLEAQERGLIVSTFERTPASVPSRRVDGWWITLCGGGGVSLRADQVRIGTSGHPILLRP